jgi:hypothetical protein
MKNIFLSLALASLVVVGFASTASAAVCGELDANGVLIQCGNGDPRNVMQPWGLTGHQTPTIAAGAVVVDEAGNVDTCPAWYGKMGCSDISRTDYYRNQMRNLAKQLQSRGFAVGIFSYWLTH